jgi:multicomponent Na+:H+ antiporter subunit D
VMLAVTAAGACTGGAVLRAAGRIFIGLGPVAGDEEASPTEEEQEKANRPLWFMLVPTILLLLLALPGAGAAGDFAEQAATHFMHPDVGAILGMTAPTPGPLIAAHEPSSADGATPWLSVSLAVIIAAFALTRRRLPRALTGASDWLSAPVVKTLNRIHSGLIGDYVAWIMLGLALFAMAFAFS